MLFFPASGKVPPISEEHDRIMAFCPKISTADS